MVVRPFTKRKKKKIFRRKFFKKKIYVLPNILRSKCLYYNTPIHCRYSNIVKKTLSTYKKYLVNRFCKNKYIGNINQKIKFPNSKLFSIILSQKSQNIKCTFVSTKVMNTFTTGTVLEYFGINLQKHLRRDIKTTKMFLNFLRLFLEKKYHHDLQKSTLLFCIVGFNYSMLILKKNIKNFVLSIKCNSEEVFSVFKIKVSFTKKKNKRVKSIKKRLKKNILSNFLKKINIKLI